MLNVGLHFTIVKPLFIYHGTYHVGVFMCIAHRKAQMHFCDISSYFQVTELD